VKQFLSLLLIGCCFFMMVSPCGAEPAKVGIGISVKDDGGILYVPIRLKSFMIEPVFSYAYNERDQDLTNSTLSVNSKQSEKAAGLGVYFIKPLRERMDLLLGLRFMYLDYKEQQTSSTGTTNYDYSVNGIEIAPSLGIEYELMDHVSLGGYLRLVYQTLSGDYNSDTSTEYDIETDSFETESELFVKFYF
jgi:hypothetical protein